MAGDDGRRARLRRGWSDLPGDILDMVYRGCCSSPYDRIRFAAICSSWRAVASWHPKLPALPLLLPSTGNAKRDRKARAYILEEDRALRAPLRGFPWGKRIVGSYNGGWLAAVAGTRLFIVNAFSGARVTLSAKQSIIEGKCPTSRQVFKPRSKTSTRETCIRKIIFSEDPSSSACILAAITTRCEIALCRVGYQDDGWTTAFCDTGAYDELTDIAFCNGKLYGLAYGELFKFDVRMSDNEAPVVTSVTRMHIERGILRDCGGKSHKKYIFELRGKLAIAVKFSSGSGCCKSHFFRVFELMENGLSWVELTNLDDHALFLGPACSTAVNMPSNCGQRRVERNRIYHSEQQLCPHHEAKCLNRLDLGSYTLYQGKRKCSQGIRSWGYHYGHEDASNGCIWLLPPDM
ncbi:unnamed protein product [Alopecurus aequalis]